MDKTEIRRFRLEKTSPPTGADQFESKIRNIVGNSLENGK
jgi:hypothetical protein